MRQKPARYLKESGQALLVILLILAVVLTIGLAIISRSITDVQISQQTEESARAFSAAEAGIELALSGSSSTSGQFTETGATYQVASLPLGEGQSEFAFPGEYKTNEIMTLWLSENDSPTFTSAYDRNQLRILWGKLGTVDPPAIEITVYIDSSGTIKTARFALDPKSNRSVGTCPTAGACGFCELSGSGNCTNIVSNSYSCPGTETASGKIYRCGATLDYSAIAGKKIFARLRLFYSENEILGAKVAGAGTSTFPSQGTIISSVGQAGISTRKVEVQRLHPAPPGIFDFVLFSEGNLNKP